MEKSPHLIVVDDEPAFCEFVEQVASQQGYAVTMISNSGNFQQAYLGAHPDAVIIDMVMPNPDGHAIVNWLIEQNSTAKVVLVTGYSPVEARAVLLSATARGIQNIRCLTKPVSVAKLRAALQLSR